MTYEDWCKNSEAILSEAKEYNNFATKAQYRLLTDIGPRIGKLGQVGYIGCGFHYGMEQSFGKLIVALALPWQPCANHCKKIEDDSIKAIINKVIFKSLLRDVIKAEHSIQHFNKKGKKKP